MLGDVRPEPLQRHHKHRGSRTVAPASTHGAIRALLCGFQLRPPRICPAWHSV